MLLPLLPGGGGCSGHAGTAGHRSFPGEGVWPAPSETEGGPRRGPWVPAALPKSGPGDLDFTLPIVQVRCWGRVCGRRPPGGGAAGRAPPPRLVCDFSGRALGVGGLGTGRHKVREGRQVLGPAGCRGPARQAETSGGTHLPGLSRRSRFKALGPPPAPGRGLPGHAPESGHAPRPRGRVGCAGCGRCFEPRRGRRRRRRQPRSRSGSVSASGSDPGRRRSWASASGHGGRGARFALVLRGPGLVRGSLLHAPTGPAQGEGGVGWAGGGWEPGPRAHQGCARPWSLSTWPCPARRPAETSAHFPAGLPTMEVGGGRAPRLCHPRGGAAPDPRALACSCVPVEIPCYTARVTLD